MYKTKSATRKVLLNLYKKAGLQVMVSIARDLLASDVRGKVREECIAEFKTEMNGEVAEVVLEAEVQEYCKEHKEATKDWFWCKSLILDDPGGNTDFLTELDFTLFTPECIYVFECKSYAGDKKLVGSGELLRGVGNSCNVYKQNLLHVRTLNKHLKQFSKNPIYRMVMFNFSRGELEDERSDAAKFAMTCVDETTWESVIVNGAPVWNLKALRPIIQQLKVKGDKHREKHLKYVKSIEHGGGSDGKSR